VKNTLFALTVLLVINLGIPNTACAECALGTSLDLAQAMNHAQARLLEVEAHDQHTIQITLQIEGLPECQERGLETVILHPTALLADRRIAALAFTKGDSQQVSLALNLDSDLLAALLTSWQHTRSLGAFFTERVTFQFRGVLDLSTLTGGELTVAAACKSCFEVTHYQLSCSPFSNTPFYPTPLEISQNTYLEALLNRDLGTLFATIDQLKFSGLWIQGFVYDPCQDPLQDPVSLERAAIGYFSAKRFSAELPSLQLPVVVQMQIGLKTAK